MPKRTRRKAKAKPRKQPNTAARALTALGIVAAVFLLVVGGLWAMSPKPTPTAQATATQTATATKQPTATATPTAVATPSPSPVPPTATPVPQGSPFTLTLLHTNDTWGYTRPCG